MTRRRSLAGRLSRALAACVALALIVMVAASTLVMRSWMLGNMDSELHRLSQRAGEHLDVEDAPGDEVDADDDSDGGARAVQQSGGRVPPPGGPVVPGGP
ncbi:MAG: sensor histidine kinase, partial [Thermobifida sp.]|nr:sensor histidine kinase [Thermobifida sp.]